MNWSYQNTKACSVVVGENQDIFPASKATTLETNRSITSNSRPKPAQTPSSPSSGGKTDIHVNRRSRRHANTQHASSISSVVDVFDSSSPSSSLDYMHDNFSFAISSGENFTDAHDSLADGIKTAKTNIPSIVNLKVEDSTNDIDENLLKDDPNILIISNDEYNNQKLSNITKYDSTAETYDNRSPDMNLFDNELSINLTNQDANQKIFKTSDDLIHNLTVDNHNQKQAVLHKSKEISSVLPAVKSRVVVNITISSDDADKSKPMYLLSISVPTDNSKTLPDVHIDPIENEIPPENLIMIPKPLATTTTTTTVRSTTKTTIESNKFWGGVCKCSCPVCETDNSSDNYTDLFSEDYVDADDETSFYNGGLFQDSQLSTSDSLTSDVSTESTTEVPSSFSPSSEGDIFDLCPTMKPVLPPEPTILILEGMVIKNCCKE